MRDSRGALRSFGNDRSGSFAMLAATLLPVCLICAAVVIDLAMLSFERRKAQAAVDLAAIIAAQNLDVAETAARKNLSLNGNNTITDVEFGRLKSKKAKEKAKASPRVKVERGRYVATADVEPELRFRAGETPYNAARVRMSKKSRYYFAPKSIEAPVIEVAAVASAQEVAAFSVGSRLVALREGLANQLLSALVGSEVKLSVLDYNALLAADVDLFRFLDALALETQITSGRYKDVLKSDPSLADVLGALARVSQEEGAGAASQVVDRLHTAAMSTSQRVDLTTVIDLGPFAEVGIGQADRQGMPARARVMDIIYMSGVVANGETFLDLDVGAAIPGLTSLTVRLSIGEAMQHSPWLRISQSADIVSNVQIRLQLVATLLGKGPLNAAAVRVPLYLEIARAEGRLGDIRCRGNRLNTSEVDILARPSVADLWIGEADLKKKVTHNTTISPARLIEAPALKVNGKARATVGNVSDTTLTFTYDDIMRGAIKSTSTRDILESLFRSLARDLELEVNALGLGLGTGPLLKGAVAEAVGSALGALDEPVAELLELLGVSVGEADIRVNGVRCDRSVLVQ